MAEIVAGIGLPHTPASPALVAREGPQCETASTKVECYRINTEPESVKKPDVSEFIARTVRKEDYKGSEVPRNLRNAGAG